MRVVLLVVCALIATVTVNARVWDEKYVKYMSGHLKACGAEQGLTEDDLKRITENPGTIDEKAVFCINACVIKKIDGLDGSNVKLSGFYTMIENIHEGDADEIERVKNLAKACIDEVNGIADACEVANKYTDCYIEHYL
ncbi:hypothetical protein KM043_018465 [Ampulex compressa]|nr:hypothetical protein KM043_018465 [Ampulex compressa]